MPRIPEYQDTPNPWTDGTLLYLLARVVPARGLALILQRLGRGRGRLLEVPRVDRPDEHVANRRERHEACHGVHGGVVDERAASLPEAAHGVQSAGAAGAPAAVGVRGAAEADEEGAARHAVTRVTV